MINQGDSIIKCVRGKSAAHYDYAPFGAVTAQRGTFAAANPWRFSSEYAEDDTAMVYYNYRHYDPVMGRWMQRDPKVLRWEALDEDIVRNRLDLLTYLRNTPLSRVDSLGLDIYLTSGNKNASWWQAGNRFFHQEICVDVWSVDMSSRCCMKRSGRVCFSFAAVGFGFDWPNAKWLDEDSLQLGGPIRGEVYETGDQGLEDVKTLKANCLEDKEFLSYLNSLVGAQGTYSVLRHNCRKFSQEQYARAEGMYSGAMVPGAQNDCPCPVQ